MIQKLQKRLMIIVICLNNLDLVKKCHLLLSWKIHLEIVLFKILLLLLQKLQVFLCGAELFFVCLEVLTAHLFDLF